MAVSVRAVVRRAGAPVAAAVALGVGFTVVVLRELRDLVKFLAYASLLPEGSVWGPEWALLVALVVPMVIGIFLSLWLLAPIAGELRLGHVIMRSVLAVGIGATLIFVVLAVAALVGSVSLSGPVFGFAFPAASFGVEGPLAGLVGALVSALQGLLDTLPVGILFGVLAWVWLQRHPSRRPVSGMLDEV